MNMLQEGPLATLAINLGLRRQTPWERLKDIDLKDLRGLTDRLPDVDFDTSSLVVGLVLGVGLGYGLALAVRNSGFTISRARREARRALERVQEAVPTRHEDATLQTTTR